MLMEGYGCEADPVKGREWAEKARRRGYRMQGKKILSPRFFLHTKSSNEY